MNSDWEIYDKWNIAIAHVVFGESAHGRAVYLYLEHDALLRIAKSVGCRSQVEPDKELFKVVKATLLPPCNPTGIFHAHIVRVRDWTAQRLSTPPPCIAILAAFSLVAERMQKTKEFSPSNYYGPLLKMFGIEEKFRDRVGRDFRKGTPLLWDTLNRWLKDCDGRYGLPTAVAFDRRRYIGLPLSQALVRAHDRTKLPILFEEFGLQPGQRISLHVMQQLLSEWLPHSPVSSSLKNVWSKRATRERVSEVVCAELEAWQGTPYSSQSEGNRRSNNLFLAAELRIHPQLEVDLFLVARQNNQKNSRSITPSPNAPNLALSALAPLGRDIHFEDVAGTTWRSIEPSQLISYSHLLVANISLETLEGDQVYARQARRLVLLKWSESDHLFVEVRRIEFLETYLILAVQDLAHSVREVLQTTARTGFRELTHKNLCGLPPNWVAFERVQLVDAPNVNIEDLKSLQPIAGTHLVLAEGLALPGMSVWHCARLPELRVVIDERSDIDEVHISAIPILCLSDEKAADVKLAEIENTEIVDLSREASDLQDGDFHIVATCPRKNRTLGTINLRVRSGSYPRQLDNEEDFVIGHQLIDQRYFAFFGSPVSKSHGEVTRIVGALIDGASYLSTEKSFERLRPLPTRPDVLVKDVEKEAWDLLEPITGKTIQDLPICFTRGGHYWSIDPQDGKKSVYSFCKDCGIEKWRKPKHLRRIGVKTPSFRSKNNDKGVIRPQLLPAILEKSETNMELMLDALSYARTGSWRSFRTIAKSINDAPWFAHEAARCLEALGHIELEIDEKSILPKRWAIVPPTIVKPEQGPYFLAGSRSIRLMQRVTEAAETLGGKVRTVQQAMGPNIVEIHSLQVEDIQCIVEDINEKMHLSLSLSTQPASRIAAQLPPLNKIRRSLPDLTITATCFHKFDLGTGRWLSTDQMEHAGAYRLQSRPWVYAVVPKPNAGDQRNVIADVRLAKYLAASDASFSLIGYQQSCQTLYTSIGAPLPGLLERTAVLCSGQLPTPLQSGTLAYGNVPPRIAKAIWIAATTDIER